MVWERVTLFGLPSSARRVPLGPLDRPRRQLPDPARPVEGDLPRGSPFWTTTGRWLREIEQLAPGSVAPTGSRAPGHLSVHDGRLPEHTWDARRLSHWLRQHASAAATLQMRREDMLSERVAPDVSTLYPDTMALHSAQFPLQYHFAPGEVQDGVTMTVPRQAINQVSPAEIDWLVPAI